MLRSLIRFVAMLVFCALVSCDSHRENGVISPLAIESLNLSLFADDLEYIVLKTPDTLLIGDVSGVQFFKGSYYCVDKSSETINVFDQTGEFRFQINNKGDGPGEYSGLTDVYVDDFIYVLSRPSKKIIRFSLDGVPRDQIKLPMYIESLWPLENGNYISYSSTGGLMSGNNRQAGIGMIQIDQGIFDYDVLSSFGGEYATFGNVQSEYFTLSSDRKSVLLLNPTDTIYEIKKTKVSPKYILDFGRLSIPKNLRLMNNTADNSQRLLESDYVVHKDKLIDSEKFLFIRFLQGNLPRMNYLVYNKSEGNTVFSGLLNNDVEGLYPYEFPMTRKSNTELLSAVSAEIIEQYYEVIENKRAEIIENLGIDTYKKAEEFYQECARYQAPVIIVTKLKNESGE